MKLTIVRVDSTDNGIFGHLTCDGDSFNCVTLENHLLCIPPGEYAIQLYESPHFGYAVPMLQGVPGREAIEIHRGNCETDSHGCILVGMHRDGFTIDYSKSAFDNLMTVLKGCNDISVTIR